MRRRSMQRAVLLPAVLMLLLTGCSSNDDVDEPQAGNAVDAITAPLAPVPTGTPVGGVLGLTGKMSETLFDSATKSLILVASEPDRLIIVPTTDFDASTVDANPTEVPLPAAPGEIALTSDGVALVPTRGEVLQVDLRMGTSTSVAIDGELRAVARRTDGGYAVGKADGTVELLDAGWGDARTVSGLRSADGIAVTGAGIAVLDRSQTSLTALDENDASLGIALRAGAGATNLTTDHYGRILIANTAGNELLVYTLGPLILRQRYPVAPGPYAVAYDDVSDLAWVSTTGSNTVTGFDLSTGSPVEKQRHSTVRQPNSIAVDSATGDLFVSSATGDGVQRIQTRGR